jgi:hypothetical protein
MVVIIIVSGKKENLMEKEYIQGLMEQYTKETLRMG